MKNVRKLNIKQTKIIKLNIKQTKIIKLNIKQTKIIKLNIKQTKGKCVDNNIWYINVGHNIC
jgi:hypothetical protein